ncbi:unnamed protein product [Prorocentrum cordatum]|uniref:C3H1-type domain-containing protein n=1 Tax=Prorocentrum cordatum TaxID=2364126 RepID=A0ABN9QG43_9DINO|nr:unnamed protein product [Polarella glacialis]
MAGAAPRGGNGTFTAHLLNKTRLCRFYESGHCARGGHCDFAHGRNDLREAPDFSYTQRCRSFMETGTCRRGSACTFAHAPEQLRSWRHSSGAERGGSDPGRGSAAGAPHECGPGLPAASRAAPRSQGVPAAEAARRERQGRPPGTWAPGGRGAEAAGGGRRPPSAPQRCAGARAPRSEAPAGGRTPLRSGAAMFVPPRGTAEEAAQVSLLLHSLDVLPRPGGAEAARQVCSRVGEEPARCTEGGAGPDERQVRAGLPLARLPPPRGPWDSSRGIAEESSDAFGAESVGSAATADSQIHGGRATEETPPQLAATVRRTFLHFFVPCEDSSLGSRRRASSAH